MYQAYCVDVGRETRNSKLETQTSPGSSEDLPTFRRRDERSLWLAHSHLAWVRRTCAWTHEDLNFQNNVRVLFPKQGSK